MNENENNSNIDENIDLAETKNDPKPVKQQIKMPVTVAVALIIICSILTFVITSSLYNNRRSAEIAEAIQNNSVSEEYEKFIQTYGDLFESDSLVKSRYIGSVPEDSAFSNNIMKAYVATLGDKYGAYFSKEELKQYNEERGEVSYGIGIISYRVFDEEYNGILISDIIEESPAEKAGLKKGDIIIAVDGIDVTKESFDKCFDSIKGKADTEVKLKIKDSRTAAVNDISVVRGSFKNKTVFYQQYNTDTAYIHISNFYDNTDEEFELAVKKAKDCGAKKYVFDVRNNTGGNLQTVLKMLDLILPEGPLIRIVDKNKNQTVHSSDDENYLDAEMAVIINGQTASAAELFAAAIRDYKKGKLVGTKTYGKGSMQTIWPLKSGAAIKISDNKYLPPYGESYDGIGITPDIEIDLSEEQYKYFYKLSLDDDPQMQEALKTFE